MLKRISFWYPAIFVALVLMGWFLLEMVNIVWYIWNFATWETPLKIDHWGTMWLTFMVCFVIAVVWWRAQWTRAEKQFDRVASEKTALLERLQQLEAQKIELEQQLSQLKTELDRESASGREREARLAAIEERLRRLLDEQIRIPAVYNLDKVLVNNSWRESMLPLIQKLFLSAQPQLEGISLEPQGGGYSGSLILQARLRHGGRLQPKPYIIKIGDDALNEEAQNIRVARNQTHAVPPVCSGPLSVVGRRGLITGVVYEFADVGGTIQSFFDFYQAPGAGLPDIARIVNAIFVGLEGWHNQKQIVDRVSLCDEYQLLYEKLAEIRAGIAGIVDEEDELYRRQNLVGASRLQAPNLRPAFCNQFPPLALSWYDPTCFVENWDQHKLKAILPFYRSIVHGDAHSRNLLIEDNQRIWYIDLSHWPNGLSKRRTNEFRRRGVKIDPDSGHTLRDMSRLEADIKFILTPLRKEADWIKAITFELDLLDESKWGEAALPEPNPAWADAPEFRKAWVASQTIRQLATPYSCDQDKRPYYWSLLQATLPLLYYTTPEFGNDEKRELWQKRYAFTAAGLLCGRL